MKRVEGRVRPGPVTRSVRWVLAAALAVAVAEVDRVVADDTLPVADPARVFASWGAWRTAYDELVAAIDAFDALVDHPVDGAAALHEVMTVRDRVYRSAREVEDFVYLRLQLDAGDEAARARQHLLDETDRRWSSVGSPWLARTLTRLGSERVDRWTVQVPALDRYAYFFRRFFASTAHPLPEEPPALRALSAAAGRQSSRVYRALSVTEVEPLHVTLSSGERIALTPSRARSILGALDRAEDRALASRTWREALGRRAHTYAALLEGVVARRTLLADARGFDDALHAHLYADAIAPEAVRKVVQLAREGTDPVRRYHALRREALDLETYGLADRFVPIVEEGARIDYATARRWILDASATLGAPIHQLVRRAFEDGWIDAVERPGKRVHGGAAYVAGHPFVLVSYTGTVDTLFQLAHELGHAIHAWVADRAQPFVSRHPSSLTGEAVAAVFEGVLVEHLVTRAGTPDEQIRVLDLAIQNLLRLFYRPLLEADFELRLYDRDGSITGPALGALYREVLRDFYGDAVHLEPWDDHGWQETPHFYTAPLYLGRYGLSAAAGQALSARLVGPVPTDRASARRAFLDLLRAGGSAAPLDLLARAGADPGDPHTSALIVARLGGLVEALARALRARGEITKDRARGEAMSDRVGHEAGDDTPSR